MNPPCLTALLIILINLSINQWLYDSLLSLSALPTTCLSVELIPKIKKKN